MKTIDIHTHGIGGHDSKTTEVDHILKIAKTHGLQGIDEIILAVYPASIKAMRENMTTIKKAMELQRREDRGEKIEAQIIGIHLEGPFLNPNKCGALNAGSFIDPTENNCKKLIDGFEDIVRIMTIAPELSGSLKLIKMVTDIGIIASMGHSNAAYHEAEAGFNAGARGITHIFNAMRGIHHREPGIAGFGLLNQDVYIEVIADPYHLHPDILELILKIKNPDRIIVVSDTVKETMPHLKGPCVSDKDNRLIGGCITVIESARRLIERGFSEDIVMRFISKNPERYLHNAQS